MVHLPVTGLEKRHQLGVSCKKQTVFVQQIAQTCDDLASGAFLEIDQAVPTEHRIIRRALPVDREVKQVSFLEAHQICDFLANLPPFRVAQEVWLPQVVGLFPERIFSINRLSGTGQSPLADVSRVDPDPVRRREASLPRNTALRPRRTEYKGPGRVL
jgi:hypothetical protein